MSNKKNIHFGSLKPKGCDCEEWGKGMKKIIDMIHFCGIQTAAPKWNEQDPKFKFCPWCGKNLEYLDSEEKLESSENLQ